jgi:hypothetical protein
VKANQTTKDRAGVQARRSKVEITATTRKR